MFAGDGLVLSEEEEATLEEASDPWQRQKPRVFHAVAMWKNRESMCGIQKRK